MTHELSLIANLLRKVEDVAARERAGRVTRVSVWLGALAHTSPAHFREHWKHAARETVAAGAELEIQLDEDHTHPLAQEIILRSVDVTD